MIKIDFFSEFNPQLKKYWEDKELFYSANFFQSYDWLKNWYDNIGQKTNLEILIIVGTYNGKTGFILPLCIKRENKISVFNFSWWRSNRL